MLLKSEIVGEYGQRPLYRMLGYFSIIGLLRVHVLLGDFTLALKVMDNVELLLSEADRVGSDAPLDLNDILEEIGPDSRVVRLFDRKAMAAPTPGQLQSRISEHMKGGTSRSAPPNLAGPSDASKALSEALAELRRSLR